MALSQMGMMMRVIAPVPVLCSLSLYPIAVPFGYAQGTESGKWA